LRAQAKANTPHGIEPVVAIKKNKTPPHVLISWPCFLNLITHQTASHETPKTKRQRLESLADSLRRLAAEVED
jgi:hypothetical protein